MVPVAHGLVYIKGLSLTEVFYLVGRKRVWPMQPYVQNLRYISPRSSDLRVIIQRLYRASRMVTAPMACSGYCVRARSARPNQPIIRSVNSANRKNALAAYGTKGPC